MIFERDDFVTPNSFLLDKTVINIDLGVIGDDTNDVDFKSILEKLNKRTDRIKFNFLYKLINLSSISQTKIQSSDTDSLLKSIISDLGEIVNPQKDLTIVIADFIIRDENVMLITDWMSSPICIISKQAAQLNVNALLKKHVPVTLERHLEEIIIQCIEHIVYYQVEQSLYEPVGDEQDFIFLEYYPSTGARISGFFPQCSVVVKVSEEIERLRPILISKFGLLELEIRKMLHGDLDSKPSPSNLSTSNHQKIIHSNSLFRFGYLILLLIVIFIRAKS